MVHGVDDLFLRVLDANLLNLVAKLHKQSYLGTFRHKCSKQPAVIANFGKTGCCLLEKMN